jgi:hypothetical protein
MIRSDALSRTAGNSVYLGRRGDLGGSRSRAGTYPGGYFASRSSS